MARLFLVLDAPKTTKDIMSRNAKFCAPGAGVGAPVPVRPRDPPAWEGPSKPGRAPERDRARSRRLAMLSRLRPQGSLLLAIAACGALRRAGIAHGQSAS